MKEQEISLITAQLAKLKGFDWECRGYYYPKSKFGEKYQEHFGKFNSNKLQTYSDDKGIQREVEMYSAPSQSLLQKYLRDFHKIHIQIFCTDDDEGTQPVKWMYSYVYRYDNSIHEDAFNCSCDEAFDTFELALEDGLQQALNLI